MGSFNIACSISNLDILCGEEVVVYFIGRRKEKSETLGMLLFTNNICEVITPYYLRGEYDDYGHISFEDEKYYEHNDLVFPKLTKLFDCDKATLINAMEQNCSFPMKYKFLGREQWDYDCYTYIIRKDIHDYIMSCFGYDQNAVDDFAATVKTELSKEKDSYARRYRGYKFTDFGTKIDKECRFQPNVPQMAFVYGEHSGGESGSFILKDEIVDSILDCTDTNAPNFIEYYRMFTQYFLLQKFVHMMNLVYRPGSYAGQSEKGFIHQRVYKDFSNIAGESIRKRNERFAKYHQDDDEWDPNKFLCEEYGFVLK